MYTADEVSKYLLHNYPMSNLKLQKVLYFVQAEFLVATGEPCFDNIIEAWDFGPVVPEIYNKYKIFAGGIIPDCEEFKNCSISSKDKMLISSIADMCESKSSADLLEFIKNQTLGGQLIIIQLLQKTKK